MNREVIEWIVCILCILMIPIGIFSYIKICESKRDDCINKGGYVVEDYLGIYNQCIVGEDNGSNN